MTFLSRFLISITVLILLSFNYSVAATYYVATNGNNNNMGTSASPWKSIAYAVDKMKAGDTTYVRGGIYQEGPIRFSNSGTSTAPIKLLGVAGQNPVVNFIDPKNSAHRIVVQNGAGYNKAMGYITIEGFELRNGYNGIKFYNLHNSVIRRNWIHHNTSQGILGIGGHHNVFERNRVNHNGNFAMCARGGADAWICNQEHGFYMHGNFYTITNNLIYDNLGFGIQINGSPTSAYKPTMHAGIEFTGAKNWSIVNNTFAYNVYRAGITLWGSPKDMRIENNIFYENCVIKEVSKCTNVQGIEFTGTGTRGAIIRNNLFFATGTGAVLPYSSAALAGLNYTASGNIVNTLNPKFVNAPATMPSSPNFALSSLSPAINRGLNNSLTRLDFLGRLRQGAYDIGAYEYLSGSSSTALPKSPSNFQLKSD